MGSFNTTCFVTQQTISYGDEVVLFPILCNSSDYPVSIIDKNGNRTGVYANTTSTCYPDAFWEFCGQYITAEYDDYGDFTLHTTEDNKESLVHLFKLLKERSYITEAGENSCHDLAFDMSELEYDETRFESLLSVFNEMWEVSVGENRVFVKSDFKGLPKELSFAVMHKSAFDYLIGLSENAVRRWNPEGTPRRTKIRAIFNYSRIISSDILMCHDINISQGSGNLMNLYGVHFNEAIIAHLKQPTETSFESVVDSLDKFMNHCYVDAGLEVLNIKIQPIVYCGQDYDNSNGDSYLELVMHVNQKVNERISSQNDEFEENE